VGKGEKIGDFGLIGGGAAGLEIDAFDRALGSPPHTLVLASSEGHKDSYRICVEELGFTYPGTAASENAAVHADMVFYETPNGGGVFSTGSIAWAGSLSHDNYENNVSRISANVLNRFLDSTPLGPTAQ
jgi:N,N-dimethylformamidase